MRKFRFFSLGLFIACLLAGASLSAEPPALRITSIENNAVAPANWRPIVEWEDDVPAGTEYAVTFSAGKASFTLTTDRLRLTPPAEQFAPLLKEPVVDIIVQRLHTPPKAAARANVKVRIAADPFTDTVVYRLVEPLFNPTQDALVNVLRPDAEKPETLRLAASLCLGCHTYQGNAAAMNVRRDKDRRLIADIPSGAGSAWADFPIGEFSFIAFSPNGKSMAVAFRTKSFIITKKSPIEPFDMTYIEGDIGTGPRGEANIVPLPGASEPTLVEDMPVWSPDGKTIVFCRYAPNKTPGKLNPAALYRIPAAGGEAQPLMNKPLAAYCYFPKYSPDGRWISFVAGDASHSYFARRSADIWLYDTGSGAVRKLESNRAGAMDSWHAWSADGRWLVFSSNRSADNLTGLWLTRIDASGRASPPVKLAGDAPWKANLPFLLPAGSDFRDADGLAAFLGSIYPER